MLVDLYLFAFPKLLFYPLNFVGTANKMIMRQELRLRKIILYESDKMVCHG